MVRWRWKDSGAVVSAWPTFISVVQRHGRLAAAIAFRRDGKAATSGRRASRRDWGDGSSPASSSSSSRLLERRDHAAHIVFGERAFGDELRRIKLQRRRMILDRAIHQRLRERRLVGLVVTEAPVAEHVDDDVLVEQLAEFRGDPRDNAPPLRDRRRSRGRSAPAPSAPRPTDRAKSAHKPARVVKPIWLLTTKWIVPPVRKPLVPDIAKHSATTPWPANAASPCSSSGMTLARVTLSSKLRTAWRAPCRARRDRTLRDATGSAVSDRCTLIVVELAVRRGAEMIFHVARALHFARLARCRPGIRGRSGDRAWPSHWRAR